MAPQTLLLMRHAEKPADDRNPDLSAIGSQRASKLPARVQSILGAGVQFIFAARISANSNRAVETVMPLSLSTGVPINSQYSDKSYEALAQKLLSEDTYRDKRIVVCWHHDDLPGFADALGTTAGSYPDPWPGQMFDLILEFEWDLNALTVTKSWDE